MRMQWRRKRFKDPPSQQQKEGRQKNSKSTLIPQIRENKNNSLSTQNVTHVRVKAEQWYSSQEEQCTAGCTEPRSKRSILNYQNHFDFLIRKHQIRSRCNSAISSFSSINTTRGHLVHTERLPQYNNIGSRDTRQYHVISQQRVLFASSRGLGTLFS